MRDAGDGEIGGSVNCRTPRPSPRLRLSAGSPACCSPLEQTTTRWWGDARPVCAVGRRSWPLRCRRTRGRGWSTTPRTGAVSSAARVRSRCVQPVLPLSITSTRSAPKRPAGQRRSRSSSRARRTGTRRFPRVFLRLRDPAPELYWSAPRARPRTLAVTSRRPTPLDTELHFDIQRVHDARGITADGPAHPQRRGADATGTADTAALPRNGWSASRFGRRARPDRWPHPASVSPGSPTSWPRACVTTSSVRLAQGGRRSCLAGEPVHRVRREPARVARGDPHPGGRRPGLGAPAATWAAPWCTCRRPNALRIMISMVAAVAVLDAGRRQRRAHPPRNRSARACAAREDRLTEVGCLTCRSKSTGRKSNDSATPAVRPQRAPVSRGAGVAVRRTSR